MRHPKSLLLSLALLAVATCNGRLLWPASPTFNVRLSLPEVRAGHETQILLDASWHGLAEECLIGEIVLELPENLERVGQLPASSSVSFENKLPQTKYSCQLEIRPLKAGDYEIKKLQVKFRQFSTRPDEWETWQIPQSLKLHVKKSLLPKSGLGTSAAILGGFLLVGVAFFLYASARYRRKQSPEAAPDHESKALSELADLRSLRIRGDTKAYFAQLVLLLNSYVEQKYRIQSPSEHQLLEALARGHEEVMRRRLSELLELAENVRFGGAPPLPTDLDRAHNAVKELLESNQPVTKKSPEDEIVFRSG